MNKIVFGIVIILLFICVGFTSITGVNVEQTRFSLNANETAWWKASECDGTTLWDCSGHNYDGTVYGADWTPGCCLNFDGVDDFVDLDNHSLALGINKTDDCEVYIRFKSIGSGMLYSMSHTNPERAYFDLMLDEEGRITVEMGDETCLFDLSTSQTFNDGEWHLVECYFEGDTTNPTLDIYVDGESEATTTEWLSPMLDEDFLTAKIGRDSNAESDYFDGMIDDIKIYKLICCGTPPEAPTIYGPTEGGRGDTLIYIFSAIDPDGDDVRFHIDWGDGNTEWTTYIGSGVDKMVSHTWDCVKTITITAYAEDETGLIGPCGTFTVIIPRNKAINDMLLCKLFEKLPIIEQLINFILRPIHFNVNIH